MTSKINIYNEDCLPAMKSMVDNQYDLAIVDPPYGIGIDGAIHIRKPDRPSTWDMIEKYERNFKNEQKDKCRCCRFRNGKSTY